MNPSHDYPGRTPAAAFCRIAFLTLLSCWPGLVSGGGTVNTCTENALRSAMASGGHVTFNCNGTIGLTSTITNFLDTILDGSGHEITITGSNIVRLFYVGTNVGFKVNKLTLAAGKSGQGGAIMNAGGTVTLLDVFLQQNSAVADTGEGDAEWGKGGAVYNLGGTVCATNCEFNCNTGIVTMAFVAALAGGGACRNYGGSMIFQNCAFTGNAAVGPTGAPSPGYPIPASPGGPAFGGAIQNSGTVVASFCSFIGNSATGGMGGGYMGRDPGLPGSNGGGAHGGAVYSSDGAVWLSQCLLASNRVVGGIAGNGQDAFSWDPPPGDPNPPLRIQGGNGGVGGTGGGGAVHSSSPASLINCTVAWNLAIAGNGGNGGSGAQIFGDGILPGGSGGNGGDASAGLDLASSTGLTNCTVAFNSAVAGTGGFPGSYGSYGTAGAARGNQVDGILVNTLFATNAPMNSAGKATDAGHNLSSDASLVLAGAGSMTNVNPRIQVLANNGGPTLTMALQPDSPAIDSGNSTLAPWIDQRGFPRPVGAGADIGAFEYINPGVLQVRPVQGGRISLCVFSTAGKSCILSTSTNFLDWTATSTNQVGTNGMLQFQFDCEVRNFYRAEFP